MDRNRYLEIVKNTCEDEWTSRSEKPYEVGFERLVAEMAAAFIVPTTRLVESVEGLRADEDQSPILAIAAHTWPKINRYGRSFTRPMMENSKASMRGKILDWDHEMLDYADMKPEVEADNIVGNIQEAWLGWPEDVPPVLDVSDDEILPKVPRPFTLLGYISKRVEVGRRIVEDAKLRGKSFGVSVEYIRDPLADYIMWGDEFKPGPAWDDEKLILTAYGFHREEYEGKQVVLFPGGVSELRWKGAGITEDPLDTSAGILQMAASRAGSVNREDEEMDEKVMVKLTEVLEKIGGAQVSGEEAVKLREELASLRKELDLEAYKKEAVDAAIAEGGFRKAEDIEKEAAAVVDKRVDEGELYTAETLAEKVKETVAAHEAAATVRTERVATLTEKKLEKLLENESWKADFDAVDVGDEDAFGAFIAKAEAASVIKVDGKKKAGGGSGLTGAASASVVPGAGIGSGSSPDDDDDKDKDIPDSALM